jgi:replicative DNA helicase
MTELQASPAADVVAEQAVLGAMLLDPTVIADMSAMLRAGDFYRTFHGTLFQIMVDMFGRGLPVDRMTVLSRLIETGDVERCGGAPYLHTISEYANPMSATHYARTVAERATDRAVGVLGALASQLASVPGDTAAKVATIRQAADDLTAHREVAPGLWIGEALTDAIDAIEAARSGEDQAGIIPTPFADLNRMLGGGWRPGQSVIVGARPGIGKSTFLLDCLRTAAHNDVPCLDVSLEMTVPEIMQRFLSAETRTPLAMIRTGQLRPEEEQRIADRVPYLANRPLRMLDAPAATMPYVRGEARRGVARDGLKLVGIDYIGLMSTPPKSESRQQAVAEISRSIKLMDMELGLVSITCSQLNRNPEQRADKRPTLADLRESGAMEQDADIVILLHDPAGGLAEHERAGEFDIIVAKHRGGPTGTVTVASQLHLSRFVDMAVI